MKKRIISAMITGILMVSAATILVPQTTVVAQAATKVGTVNGSNVNLRTGAGTSYKAIAKLQKGDKVNILDKKSGWYHVQVQKTGTKGYVSAEYVDAPGIDIFDDFILPKKASGKVKVGSSLNVRQKPDRNSASLGSLKNGTVVKITGISVDKKWYRIDYKGGSGFVSADYVTLI